MPTMEELKFLQSQTLDRKIRLTQTRIAEWYLKFDGKVYVSFSGGKDSTVLLDLARRMYPDIKAVFVNTGLEYPEIVEFVKTFDNVEILTPQKYNKEKKKYERYTFQKVLDDYGYPVIGKEVANVIEGARAGQISRIKRLNGTMLNKDGGKSQFNQENYKFLLDAPFKISDQCCEMMKKKPIKLYEKKAQLKPIIGLMTDESNKRLNGWLKTGCNSFDNKMAMSNPMAFWTEQDVLHYLKLTEIPYCSVYGKIVPKSEFSGQLAFDETPTDLMTTGCSRTGCMFCMFGVHLEKSPNRFQRMKITHPQLYKYCIEDLGCGKVMDFIKVKYD